MILFAGDPHWQFKPIIRATRELRPEGVVLLGDCDLDVPLEQALADVPELTDLWWIPGNHDGDRGSWFDHLYQSELADRNLHGRVVQVGGLRVAGLGGVFRGEIWHPDLGVKWRTRAEYRRTIPPMHRWRGGLPLKHRVSIWWEDYQKLADQRADILVTHEAPSSHRHGFKELDELAEMMGAKLIVHGHHHEDYQAILPSGIKVIGVGMAGVATETGEVIEPGLTNSTRRPKRKA